MKKTDLIIVADYSQKAPLTLEELCKVCSVDVAVVNELIEYEIIHPQGAHAEEWIFDLIQLQRAQTALRLQHDLEVNLPGVAIVLDLLQEIEELRARTEFWEKYFSGE